MVLVLDSLKSPTPSNDKLSPDMEEHQSSNRGGKLPSLKVAAPRHDLEQTGMLSRNFENMKPFSET